MRTILFLAAALVFLAVGLQPSAAGDWTVTRLTGSAWVVEKNLRPRALKPDMTVPTGSRVQTSRNGRVRLENDKSVMMLAPNTVADLKPKTLLRRRTTVMQTAGQIEFDIEKRGRPHFEVQTPYMAAVVKGTEFTISISSDTASISVNEGLVGVTDSQSGESADVGAGQQASAGEKSTGLSTSPGVSKSSAGKGTSAPGSKSAAKGNGKGKGKDESASNSASNADSGRGGRGGDAASASASQSESENGHESRSEGRRAGGGWHGRGRGRDWNGTVNNHSNWNGRGNGRGGWHGRGDARGGWYGRGNGRGGWHGRGWGHGGRRGYGNGHGR